jgi:hypothetical protein
VGFAASELRNLSEGHSRGWPSYFDLQAAGPRSPRCNRPGGVGDPSAKTASNLNYFRDQFAHERPRQRGCPSANSRGLSLAVTLSTTRSTLCSIRSMRAITPGAAPSSGYSPRTQHRRCQHRPLLCQPVQGERRDRTSRHPPIQAAGPTTPQRSNAGPAPTPGRPGDGEHGPICPRDPPPPPTGRPSTQAGRPRSAEPNKRTKQHNHDTTTPPTSMSVDGDNVGEAVAVGSKQEDGHFDRFLRFIVDRSN